MRILFIEDNPTLVKAFRRVAQHKYDLGIATNCAEVTNELNHKPFLVIMDIMLPDCEGLDLVRQLRTQLPDTPILATTSFATRAELQQCLDAGCNQVLTKPYSLEALLNTVQAYANQLSSPS